MSFKISRSEISDVISPKCEKYTLKFLSSSKDPAKTVFIEVLVDKKAFTLIGTIYRSSLFPHPKSAIKVSGTSVSEVFTHDSQLVSVLKLCWSIVPDNFKPHDIERSFLDATSTVGTLLYSKGNDFSNRSASVEVSTYCQGQAPSFDPAFVFDSATTTCTEFDASVSCKVSHVFFLQNYIKPVYSD